MVCGFLRETKELALKAGIDNVSNWFRRIFEYYIS